ncbi:MAG: hypothetical protein A2017_00350 [Lentisphaerae bacterium GWF2_44_16]|nr:MAG: hypothetical protein A2017_00350 [Lentisphaerae bacterium GWF2_44_16]
MPMTLAEIEKEAFTLNNEEKFLLIQDIGASLTTSQVERDWYEEAERRVKALEEGRTSARNGEDVMNELKEKLVFRK